MTHSDQRWIDTYLDPTADYENTCHCGLHQGECDGPPNRCCERCIHWTTTDEGSTE